MCIRDSCYDGKTVFNLLRNKKKDEGFSIFKNDRKIFELTKTYDETGFPDDELSLGYGINVYQETINKVFREYLVNFEYLVRVMEDYGFVLITNEESLQMKLPEPTGMFMTLYDEMEKEIKIDKRKQADYKDAMFMSPEEKRISFMNRYFVFKKVRNVDAKKMESLLKKQSQLSEEYEVQSLQEKDEKEKDEKEKITEKDENKTADEVVKKPKIKKTKKKLLINEE